MTQQSNGLATGAGGGSTTSGEFPIAQQNAGFKKYFLIYSAVVAIHIGPFLFGQVNGLRGAVFIIMGIVLITSLHGYGFAFFRSKFRKKWVEIILLTVSNFSASTLLVEFIYKAHLYIFIDDIQRGLYLPTFWILVDVWGGFTKLIFIIGSIVSSEK